MMRTGLFVWLVAAVACGRHRASTDTTPPREAPADAGPRGDQALPACASDAECSLIASCDCRRCDALPRDLHVRPCPEVCAGNPCASVVARCDVAARQCVAVDARRPADACDAPCAADADCVVATPPSCGDCVAVRRDRRDDAACVARGCRANVCDARRHGARCDASTRRCVLIDAP